MDFYETLNALLSLLGRKVSIEIRGLGDRDIATLRGTLEAGNDLGDFERGQGIGGAGHDRLLFTLREHPFPEGFVLDRRLVEDASWATDEPDRVLRISLRGGVAVDVVVHQGRSKAG